MAKNGMLDVDSEDEDEINLEEGNMNTDNHNGSLYPICKPVKASTPVSILIESLVKNLCSIYEPDESKASKIYNLVCSKLFEMKLIDESYSMREFEGMRNQYQRALYHLVTSAIGGKQPVPSLQSFWQGNDVTSDWSHYHREFDEMEYIAGGGFGQVFRVKHKLDGTEYAIKKIFIRSEGIKAVRNYLSEVKTFASLNHSHIVQYKAAWLELGAATSKNAIVDHTDSELLFTTDYESEYSSSKIEDHIDDYIYPRAVSDTETSFMNKKNKDTTDFEVNFENSMEIHHFSHSSDGVLEIDGKMVGKYINRIKRSSISEGGNAICKIEEIQHLHVQAKTNSKWATLYIQMALCQSTLKQWLEKRNEAVRCSTSKSALVPCSLTQVQTDTVMEILKQLLKGIEYIHSKNIVHHDIKPSNIFIQIENGHLVVQLGDFGLACPLQSARHSLAFGTQLYAAPEQLLGKCDPKSDMYSIGIVLLELVETFSTDMERIYSINDLRKGNLPPGLPLQQPLLSAVICQLVKNNPSKRPNATELLQQITFNVGESELVQKLRSQLAEKDDEIRKLKEMLRNAGVKTAQV